jgi:hypothetical protein
MLSSRIYCGAVTAIEVGSELCDRAYYKMHKRTSQGKGEETNDEKKGEIMMRKKTNEKKKRWLIVRA